MLVSPSKLKPNRIAKNRTLTFETVKKTHKNLIMIAANNDSQLEKVIKTKLFRPQQLMCSFIPRIIRPMNRKMIRLPQKQFYSDMKEKTNGKLKIGKVDVNFYANRNLLYNIVPEYDETLKEARKTKPGISLQKYLWNYFEDLMESKIEQVGYDKNYLIFPVTDYIPNFKGKILTDYETSDPLILFLRSLRKNTVNKSVFDKFDLILFFNPDANALFPLNIKTFDPTKNYQQAFIRIDRLNNFNNGTDMLNDDVDLEDAVDPEDEVENMKEQIKELVLNKVAKSIKADKLTDFEAATKDEQDIALSIDRKIEEYLSNEENIKKPFNELVAQIESDKEVKTKAVKYVETKKISEQKLAQLSKNLEKEVEVINSIKELDIDDMFIEPDVFEVKGVDKRVTESKLSSLDEEYNRKQSMKDMMNILASFSSSYYLPMTLESFEKVDTSDDFKQVDTIFAKFRTDEGKLLSFSLDIPKVVDKRYFFLGGNKKVLVKQLARLPIVKTKPDRVEITTNYNKITIERTNGKLSRRNSYLLKILKEVKNNPNVTINLGSNNIVNANYKNDFEYEELAGDLTSIITPKYEIMFNRKDLEEEIAMLSIPENFFDEEMTPVGINRSTNSVLYIKNTDLYEFTPGEKENSDFKIADSLFDFIYTTILDRKASDKLPQIGKSFIFTKMKILGESYPIFVVVGLMNGLTDILKRYKVEYKITDTKLKSDSDYVEIKFKDKYLYYKDTVKNTLLLNVLYMMSTEEYDISEFDQDKPYTDFFIDKLDQPIYIKNTLRINLNVVIDPITREVLKDLKLPTDIIDLLLLGNTMLTSNAYRPQNDIRNFRIRGNEIVFAMMYQILADAYVRYQRGKLNGRNIESLDIPRNILVSRLLQEPNVNDHSTLNPVLEMENIASISAKGFRGINLGDAYTLELRAYDESMVGIIAGNATPFGPNSGVTRGLTYNPIISSVRGYITDIENRSRLEPTNVLSPTEMLSSFTSTQADPPRQAMQVSQTKHTMPVVKTHKQLIGSGVNKTMAFMISDDFVFKAKEDGVVELMDLENQLAILKYDNGTKDAIDLSEVFVKNSNSGFYIKQKFLVTVKQGERFKKGDALAYNPSFFDGKGKDIDYKPGTLTKIAISPMDLSYEDSTVISEALSEKAASYVTMLKQVALGPNTIIHKIVEVGQVIRTGDTLLDFTTSFEDPGTSDFLADLAKSLGTDIAEAVGNEKITSKYTGTVANIRIYYNRAVEDLSPSLQQLIKKYKAKVQKRKNVLGGIKSSNLRIPPVEQQTGEKVGTEEYDGVLIEFYTEYYNKMSAGDKLTYSTALKGVISKVLAPEEAPLTEYREEETVEAILTPTGIISRMTADIYSMLYGNKVLVELGKQIKEIMEDKR
jgi:hypothetical protein